MEFKGTKGKWHACCKSNKPHFLFAGEGEVVLCSFYQEQDDGTELPLKEVQANARLIECAPEMLEMLQYFVKENMLSIVGEEMAIELIKKATEI
jgi:hypothetical protein